MAVQSDKCIFEPAFVFNYCSLDIFNLKSKSAYGDDSVNCQLRGTHNLVIHCHGY